MVAMYVSIVLEFILWGGYAVSTVIGPSVVSLTQEQFD